MAGYWIHIQKRRTESIRKSVFADRKGSESWPGR